MSGPDGFEEREFDAEDHAARYDIETERLEDCADTDYGEDFAQAAMVAHFIDRVLW
jgi:hypothetical protein